MPDDPKKKGTETDPNAAMMTAIGEMSKAIAGIPAAVEKSMSSVIARMPRQAPADKKPDDTKGKKPDRKAPTGDELEAMDRKDFMEHVLREFKTQLIDPLEEKITKSQATTMKKELKTKWEDFSGKKGNKAALEKLAPELKAVLEENPSLMNNPEDALLLAKERAPDKAKELDEAAKKAAEDEKKADGKKDDKGDDTTAFGGLTPSSGSPGASDEKGEPEKIGLKDAANEAWDKTMANLPAELIGGSP